jgi:hypothetical protein
MPIRSYVRSTDCHRVSHGQDITCSVDVAVMVHPTLWALPLSNLQRQPLDYVTTVSAALRAGEPTVNFHQSSTIPLAFVFQLPHQLTPPGITDGTSETVVFDHIFHSQVLNGNRLVFTHQSCRQLVGMVLPGIRIFA